jgi:hypothetical protein
MRCRYRRMAPVDRRQVHVPVAEMALRERRPSRRK